MKTRLFILILLLLYGSHPQFSFAFTEITTGGSLSAEIIPEDPGAFTETSIHLTSYEVDLASSNIIWKINGKKQQEGVGKNTISFVTGDIGKKIVIFMAISGVDDKIIEKTISIVPAEVNLIWQSDGTVPPFYRGKSLSSGQTGPISFVAIPNFVDETGRKINSDELIYRWQLNFQNKGAVKGNNRKKVSLDSNSYKNTIFVESSNSDGSIKASRQITFTPLSPKVLFYKTSSLSGPKYNLAINKMLQMEENELTIIAVPYFFDEAKGKDKLKYLWSINDTYVKSTSADMPNSIILRQPKESSGIAVLNLNVNNSSYDSRNNLLQIKFGQDRLGF